MLKKMVNLLEQVGPLTSSRIALSLGKQPVDIISELRDAVERGVLGEKNGYYTTAITTKPRRRSYEWVEGHHFPDWVLRLATGPRGCESLIVLAELDAGYQKQGWPMMSPAIIDVGMGHIQCSNTGKFITDHVVRYLPLDTTVVRAL